MSSSILFLIASTTTAPLWKTIEVIELVLMQIKWLP